MPARQAHMPTVWERFALDACRRSQPLPGGVGNGTHAKEPVCGAYLPPHCGTLHPDCSRRYAGKPWSKAVVAGDSCCGPILL